MFKQFFEVFWPKAVEYVAEQALNNFKQELNNVEHVNNFKHTLENLQQNLKLLMAKAFDVETEIRNAEYSGRKERKRQVEEWLEDVRSFETQVYDLGSQVELQGSVIMRLMDGGGKAAQLNMKAEKLVQQRLDFGELVLDVCGTRGHKLLTNGMVGRAFHEDLERILKLLENGQALIIGVFGMGGIGKTTLAMHIHNRLVKQAQGRVFWVTVSQDFTITGLQDKIARCFGVNLSDEDSEDKRAGKLIRFSSKMKNSVLIFDDVWEKIDMLKVGCTFSVECCRLIITSRSSEVCREFNCQELIEVVKLHNDEAWKLFNETLGNEMQLSLEVEGIAKSMAELCDGLPRRVIEVAEKMRGEKLIRAWINALEDLEDCVMED